MIFFDAAGRIVEANDAAVAAYGYSRDELVGLDFVLLRAPETRGLFEAQIRSVREGPLRFETDHVRKDGSRFPVEAVWTSGEVRGRLVVLSTIRDISERRRAEEALHRSEAQLRGFYNAAPVFMGVTELGDGDVLHLYDNPATCRFFGVEPGSTTGKWALAELGADPATVALWSEHYRASLESGTPRQFEHVQKRGPEERWLSVTVCSIGEGEAGRPRFCYVAEDVTERKRSERAVAESAEALARERERLSIALLAGRLGVYEWRMKDDSLWWSPEMYPLYGVEPDSFVPGVASFLALVHPADRDELWRKTEEAIAQSTLFAHEYRIVPPHGEVRWIRNRSQVGVDALGRADRITGVAVDVTERKQGEEQVQLLLHEVNHRAKNLLAMVQAIARRTMASGSADFMESFDQRLRALAACQDILVRSEWKDVSLEDLVRSQLAPFGPELGARVSLAGPSVELSADAAQALGMALHELATNAVKYGALSTSTGAVAIAWDWKVQRGAAAMFELSWRERNGPLVSKPKQRGFGSTVIETVVSKGLSGEVTLDFASSGLTWSLACPASNVLHRGDAGGAFRSVG